MNASIFAMDTMEEFYMYFFIHKTLEMDEYISDLPSQPPEAKRLVQLLMATQLTWDQIQYKYKYKESNTNTNTIPNTRSKMEIQIQIHGFKYNYNC